MDEWASKQVKEPFLRFGGEDGPSMVDPTVLTENIGNDPVKATELGLKNMGRVLGHLQHGHSYDDIATALGLSVNTVRSHVRSVYERLGVSSKVEAVMVAMELGLLQATRFTTQFPPKP